MKVNKKAAKLLEQNGDLGSQLTLARSFVRWFIDLLSLAAMQFSA